FLVPKPPLHRDKLGGGGDCVTRPFWCRSLRSTGTSSVGARRKGCAPSGAKASAPPGQARWGRDASGALLLVQKPSLHRDKLGGGGAQSGLAICLPPLRQGLLQLHDWLRRGRVLSWSRSRRIQDLLPACGFGSLA